MNESEASSISSTPRALLATPYKGLDYFRDEEVDRLHFAGRSRDIAEVVARVCTRRAVVLYGRSGLGKTSLLLAGVFPELRERKFRPVYVRTLDSPLTDVANAVVRDCSVGEDSIAVQNMRDLVRQAAKGGTVVLVLDQFEEFYIRSRERIRHRTPSGNTRLNYVQSQEREEQGRAEFVHTLVELAIDRDCDTRIVFSLREDYLAALDDFQRELPDLFAEAYRLLPLSPFGAREAITQPLENEHIGYQEAMVHRLLEDLAEFDFDSARLQITCQELFRLASVAREGRSSDRFCLTEGDLIGLKASLDQLPGSLGHGLARIFRGYVQAAVGQIPQKDHLQARLLLEALMTSERTKQALSFQQLQLFKTSENGSAERLKSVLKGLERQQLLRSETRGETEWYELIHECLQPEIEAWLREDDQFRKLLLARDLVANACRENWRETPAIWLTKDQLTTLVGEARSLLRLKEDECDFLLHSAIAAGVVNEAVFWANKVSWAHAGGVVLKILESSDAAYRRGAATTAISIGRKDSRIIEKCCELALHDNDDQVREIAAASFGELAGEDRIRRAASCIPLWRPSRQAIDFLGRIRPERLRAARVDIIRRNISHWSFERLACRRFQDQLKQKITEGAVWGFISGVVWFFLVGSLVVAIIGEGIRPYLGGWSEGMGFSPGIAPAMMPIVGGLSAILGAWLGRSVGRRGEIIALTSNTPEQTLGVSRSFLIFFIFSLWVGCLLSRVLGNRSEFTSLRLVFVVLSVCVGAVVLGRILQQVVAAAVRIFCTGATTNSSGVRLLVESFCANIALVCLPAVPLVSLRGALGIHRWTEGFCWLFSLFLLLSFMLFVCGCVTMRLSGDRISNVSPKGRGSVRFIFGLAVAMFVIWCLRVFSLDVIPWRPFRPVWRANKDMSLAVTRWPDVQHVNIHAHSNLLFQLIGAPQIHTLIKTDIEDTNSNYIGGGFYFLRSGNAHLAIDHYEADSADSGSQLWRLHEQHLEADDHITLLTNVLIFAECHFATQYQSGTWIGTLAGQVSNAFGSPLQVNATALILLNGSPSGPDYEITIADANQATSLLDNPWWSLIQLCPPIYRWDDLNAGDEDSFSDFADLHRRRNRLARFTVEADGRWHATVLLKRHQTEASESKYAPDISARDTPVILFALNVGARTPDRAVTTNSFFQDSMSASRLASDAITYLRQTNYDQALQAFEQAIKLEPRYIPAFLSVIDYQIDRAEATGQTNKAIALTNRAIALLVEAVSLDPMNSTNQNNLAWRLVLAGRFADALPYAEHAVHLAPNQALYQDTLGHAAYGTEQWKLAVAAWEKTVALDPKFYKKYTNAPCNTDLSDLQTAKEKLARGDSQSRTNNLIQQP